MAKVKAETNGEAETPLPNQEQENQQNEQKHSDDEENEDWSLDDTDDDTDDENVIELQHIKTYGLKLNKPDAMELQHHITRIAMHGTDQHEIIKP